MHRIAIKNQSQLCVCDCVCMYQDKLATMQNRDKDLLHTGVCVWFLLFVCVHVSRCEDKNMSVGNNQRWSRERDMHAVFDTVCVCAHVFFSLYGRVSRWTTRSSLVCYLILLVARDGASFWTFLESLVRDSLAPLRGSEFFIQIFNEIYLFIWIYFLILSSYHYSLLL